MRVVNLGVISVFSMVTLACTGGFTPKTLPILSGPSSSRYGISVAAANFNYDENAITTCPGPVSGATPLLDLVARSSLGQAPLPHRGRSSKVEFGIPCKSHNGHASF